MNVKLTSGTTIEVNEGESLLDALKRNEIYLIASCGGKGVCGKCKVRVIEGEPGAKTFTKLTDEERESGHVLACTSFPQTDLHLEIPESSRLVVGDKIATQKADALHSLFDSFNVKITPMLKTIELHLQPPSIDDNVSDLDRLRRALDDAGYGSIRFSHGFTRSLANALRKPQWKVSLGCFDDREFCEAVFIKSESGYKRYGAAVDIGTTTVVVYIVDLEDGKVIDVGSTYNSQMRHGDDVITRIVHATEGGGLSELKKAIVSDINGILKIACERHKIDPRDIESMVVAGNTTMAQLFWGLNPGPIREEPYIPTLNAFPMWKARAAGIYINTEAPIYTLPSVASYVGGDIVAGVLASKMYKNEEIALFMDIGTNGEIALGGSDWLMAAACSAGPCFEGGGIRHGMRATEGAIEAVTINPETLEPAIRIIGGTRAIGICGSGMIDAISEMFITGVLDQKGKYVSEKAGKYLRKSGSDLEYVFFEDDEGYVALTEVDIENIIRAKAAIYAGVSLMLTEMGLTENDIAKVYIAGGFGNFLNVKKAIILGMLPDIPEERYVFLGNTSVAGAYLTLLSPELRKEAEEVAAMMTYMELSVSGGFMDEYMSAMFLPHTDINKFPTVKALLDARK
jgi:uncharacterized 2Fe-2S/4Fe-4S cluster protein (DUF4445 family)